MDKEGKRRIIIDTDPGVDDAFAIITAFSYEGFQVEGITTVAGNKSLAYVTDNALKLVHLMGADCKVYAGSNSIFKDYGKPLGEEMHPGDTHGIDGLGGIDLDLDRSRLSETHAVDFILDTVRAHPDEIEIFAIGPLTNLALAIKREPETMKRVKTIWSMGGGVRRGNMTPVAEFNYWFDPEAADLTFSIGCDVDIYMFGLDVTYKTFFTANDFFFLKEEGGTLGKHLHDMAQDYMCSYWQNRKITGAVIHDLVPVMYAIDPSISKEKDVYRCTLNVSCHAGLTQGQTIADLENRFDEPRNAYVVMNADGRRFKENFLSIVFPEALDTYKRYVVS